MSLTAEQHERAASMLDDGCSFREIARTLHVDRNLLSAEFPGRGWTYSESASFGRSLRARAGCGIRGCDKPHRAKGMCTTHYQRAWSAARKATA